MRALLNHLLHDLIYISIIIIGMGIFYLITMNYHCITDTELLTKPTPVLIDKYPHYNIVEDADGTLLRIENSRILDTLKLGDSIR